MTRAAICGGQELAAAAAILGLADAPDPEVVLLDSRLDDAVARAATIAVGVPRVVVATGPTASLLRAAGVAHVAASSSIDTIGPYVAAAAPRRGREATRLVVVTAARGGVGRTLLATGLARRVARTTPIWLLDATGTGAAAWWLRTEPVSWSGLEPMSQELTIEHLRVVAVSPLAELRVLGGAGPAPSPALLAACLRALGSELVIVDGPLLAEERTRSLLEGDAHMRRTLVVTYGDAVSLAMLRPYEIEGAWLIGSQLPLPRGQALRTLPRDDLAVAAAAGGSGAVGGRLGRAYDDLAELLLIDAA